MNEVRIPRTTRDVGTEQDKGCCVPTTGYSETLTTDEKPTEDHDRLAFICSKAKYAPPIQGMFGGAWQITLTVGPGEIIAPDFFDAIDRARQLSKLKI